ncbi:LYR motif-containing protein 2 [Sergentomyia squamirostris]
MKKPALTLKQFMLRQEVLGLYREIFRTIKRVPSIGDRGELKDWARRDFRSNSHHTDETTIKMMLQYGRRCLTELQNSLNLSGNK